MDKAKKQFAINVLRRGSYRWYGRWQAEKRSKLAERNSYFCEECGVIGKKKEFQMDHTIPVVLTSGWDNFDAMIDRLYCEPSGFKRLCKPCHQEKTNFENSQRGEPDKPSKKRAKAKKKA